MESLSLTPPATESLATLDLPICLRGCENAVQLLRETGRMFHARGWSVGTSSNYSLVIDRDPLQLLVTASGRDKGNLQARDFVRVDGEGMPVVADQPKASAETLLHCALARQTEVGAVLHTHSIWGTVISDLFSAAGGLAIEDYEMLKGLEGIQTHQQRVWVPIFENNQDIPALSLDVERRLLNGDGPMPHGFLLRQHGLYTWGRDLFAVRRHVEVFEFLFECVAQKIMLQNSLATAS